MRIIERGPDGTPREYALTEIEAVIKEIHGNLVDQGMSQGEALSLMLAGRLTHQAPALRDSPLLDAMVEREPEFFFLLAD